MNCYAFCKFKCLYTYIQGLILNKWRIYIYIYIYIMCGVDNVYCEVLRNTIFETCDVHEC